MNTWALFLAETKLSRCLNLQKRVSAFVKYTVLKQYTGIIYRYTGYILSEYTV
jgi:hypothetical protein